MGVAASDYFEIDRPIGDANLEKSIIFVVEGQDDCWFLGSILQELNISPAQVRVIPTKGISNFPQVLNQIFKSRPLKQGIIERLALVRDADDSFVRAQEEAGELFIRHGYPAAKHGDIVAAPGSPMMGLYIFPAEGMQGDLEALCFDSVESTDHGQHVMSFMSEARRFNVDRAEFDAISKRHVQAYLASKEGERCRGVGRAYNLGYFPHEGGALNLFKEFVRRMLFNAVAYTT